MPIGDKKAVLGYTSSIHGLLVIVFNIKSYTFSNQKQT